MVALCNRADHYIFFHGLLWSQNFERSERGNKGRLDDLSPGPIGFMAEPMMGVRWANPLRKIVSNIAVFVLKGVVKLQSTIPFAERGLWSEPFKAE